MAEKKLKVRRDVAGRSRQIWKPYRSDEHALLGGVLLHPKQAVRVYHGDLVEGTVQVRWEPKNPGRRITRPESAFSG